MGRNRNRDLEHRRRRWAERTPTGQAPGPKITWTLTQEEQDFAAKWYSYARAIAAKLAYLYDLDQDESISAAGYALVLMAHNRRGTMPNNKVIKYCLRADIKTYIFRAHNLVKRHDSRVGGALASGTDRTDHIDGRLLWEKLQTLLPANHLEALRQLWFEDARYLDIAPLVGQKGQGAAHRFVLKTLIPQVRLLLLPHGIDGLGDAQLPPEAKNPPQNAT